MKVLHVSHNHSSYSTRIDTIEDLATLIRDVDVEAICAHQRLDFWTTPSLRARISRINTPAIKMLLATSGFRPGDVPLLRGSVVVTTHDEHGQLCGLTSEQLHWLVDLPYTLPRIASARIDRRIRRTEKADQRRRQAERAHELKNWKPPQFSW